MSSSAPSPHDPNGELTVRESITSACGEGGDTLFDRYRTVRELGRGGMGLVMLAHDTVLDVPVALKLVPEIVLRDSEGIVDLKKEVLRGMELTHPNIVRVFSFEQNAKTAMIVMEHVEGETLGQKKAQRANRCFDCEEILPWVEQLCSALDYAHQEARIAHRDLKPGNLLLTSAGRLKVADFGIASSLSDTMSRVSVRVDTSGTPPYMSPQQAMGERPTHLDDIYSLGATIYELLTGKPPFFRGNILAQVMHE
jgi:serine/threonine protein kinase